MNLKKRHLVVCDVLIQGRDEPRSKAVKHTVSLGLPDTKPETITMALAAFLEQCWSSDPHSIEVVFQIKNAGELYAAVDAV